MKEENINEFIEKDGTLINSKMPPSVNGMAVSNKTTDQHVSASRQGMVWMNYRRFYGEDNEVLPFTKEADKWEKDPEKFFKFLKSKGKEKEFSKYFVKKDTETILKESGRMKMRELVEDIVTKKKAIGDIVSKKDDISLEDVKEKNPAILKKIEDIAESIKSSFTEGEQDVIIDYITQIVNS